MTPETETMLNETQHRLIEVIEENTEKLQEILERIECIDNTLDDIKEKD